MSIFVFAETSIFVYAFAFMALAMAIALWVWCIMQIVGRPDIRLWVKVFWLVGILAFPILGAVVFLVYISKRGPLDDTAAWDDKSAEEIEGDAYRAAHMTSTDRAGNQPYL